jgi:hypothetical protein
MLTVLGFEWSDLNLKQRVDEPEFALEIAPHPCLALIDGVRDCLLFAAVTMGDGALERSFEEIAKGNCWIAFTGLR